MIDNKTCSDDVFALKDDNDQMVHANKGILIGQNEYFRVMFPVITLDPIFDYTSRIGIICRFDGRSPNSGSGTSSY